MFGLTFLEPAFLFGLALAPLPILIHLFQRRRAKVVSFSSLEFVRPFQRPRTRRIDPRRLLLLALRVSALALLALALARPSLPGRALSPGMPSDVVIVLDASLSMSSRAADAAGGEGGEESLFERARGRAREALSLMKPGDRAALLIAGNPEAPAAHLSDDFTALGRALEEARPAEGRLVAREALARAVEVLRASARESNREIQLVSDLQRSGWEESPGGSDETGATGSLRQVGALLEEEGVRLYPIPVGSPAAGNLSLDEIRAGWGAGERLEARALVRNHGERPVDGVAVQLFSPGLAPASAVVSVGSGEAAWAVIAGQAARRGALEGRVQLPPDPQPADNARYFALAGEGGLRIVLVGRPSAEEPGSLTSRYLREALAPAAGATAATVASPAASFEVEEIPSGEATPSGLAEADVVVLADCEALAPATLAALKSAVAEGTGLVVFLGPGTDVGYLNRAVFPDLVDVTLEETAVETEPAGGREGQGPPGGASADRSFGWGASETHHPIFAVFDGPPREALARARFTRCLRARPGTEVRVLASFTNGLPALLEGRHGRGTVLLFTSSPDLSWGNLPLSGNFVPFVHEALVHAASSRGEAPPAYLVGELAERELPASEMGPEEVGAAGIGLQLREPQGRTLPLVPRIAGHRATLAVGPLPRAGIYRVTRGEQLVDLFAVNADPRESDPRTIEPREVAQRLGAAEVAAGSAGESLARRVRAARYGREVTATFLWIALLLLVAEIVVRGSFAAPRWLRVGG